MISEGVDRLLKEYQVRKTRKQKQAFACFLEAWCRDRGLPFSREEQGKIVRTVNLVVGEPEKAEVVFAAHYDTCSILPVPNLITPLNVPLFLLYQLLLVAAMLLLPAAAGYLCGLWLDPMIGLLVFEGLLIGELLLMLFGPANRHTANDNTSGVATLMRAMEEADPSAAGKAAFVFFDLEEVGMIGSGRFFSAHKGAMRDVLLVNFDCVSDGEEIMVSARPAARGKPEYGMLKRAFSHAAAQAGKTVRFVDSARCIYPSDQVSFPCGVAVASLRKGKAGIRYIGRIHTRRDRAWEEENIVLLAKGIAALTGTTADIGTKDEKEARQNG